MCVTQSENVRVVENSSMGHGHQGVGEKKRRLEIFNEELKCVNIYFMAGPDQRLFASIQFFMLLFV